MGEVVQMRDFQRREEREAILARIAKEILADTAPCEMPYVWPDFQHTPDQEPA